jgi:thymidylate kinase
MIQDDRTTLAPLIAIIGCDGSGKSTVSEEILNWVQGYGPAVAAHLGKQSGNIGRAIAQLPLIGSLLDKFIARKTDSTRAQREKKTPGLLVALIIYAFSLRRLRRFKRMMAQRHQGLIIVTDRYPQLEFPGAYDGTGLSVTAPGNWFVRWLARRERVLYEWMTSYRPDLVIRLNVDLDTACARKPDHRRELLRDKVAITPQLTFNGAPIVEIDSTQPLAQVLAEAKAAVAKTLATLGYTQLNP